MEILRQSTRKRIQRTPISSLIDSDTEDSQTFTPEQLPQFDVSQNSSLSKSSNQHSHSITEHMPITPTNNSINGSPLDWLLSTESVQRKSSPLTLVPSFSLFSAIEASPHSGVTTVGSCASACPAFPSRAGSSSVSASATASPNAARTASSSASVAGAFNAARTASSSASVAGASNAARTASASASAAASGVASRNASASATRSAAGFGHVLENETATEADRALRFQYGRGDAYDLMKKLLVPETDFVLEIEGYTISGMAVKRVFTEFRNRDGYCVKRLLDMFCDRYELKDFVFHGKGKNHLKSRERGLRFEIFKRLFFLIALQYINMGASTIVHFIVYSRQCIYNCIFVVFYTFYMILYKNIFNFLVHFCFNIIVLCLERLNISEDKLFQMVSDKCRNIRNYDKIKYKPTTKKKTAGAFADLNDQFSIRDLDLEHVEGTVMTTAADTDEHHS